MAIESTVFNFNCAVHAQRDTLARFRNICLLALQDDELGRVQNELGRVSREAEQTLLDKTETINRLTKSLEEAQNQCQVLHVFYRYLLQLTGA